MQIGAFLFSSSATDFSSSLKFHLQPKDGAISVARESGLCEDDLVLGFQIPSITSSHQIISKRGAGWLHVILIL